MANQNKNHEYLVITAESGVTGQKLCKTKVQFENFIRKNASIVYGFVNLVTKEHGILNKSLWNGKGAWSF